MIMTLQKSMMMKLWILEKFGRNTNFSIDNLLKICYNYYRKSKEKEVN